MGIRNSTPSGDLRDERRDTAPDPDEASAKDTYVDEKDDAPHHATAHDYDLGSTHVSGEHALEGVAATDLGVEAERRALDSFELPGEGDTIDGRYVIERVIGRGASGIVYEASHRLIGKRIAVKVLHPQMSTSPVAVQRLFREARISASLRHPNVVEVFDAGRDGDLYYLTMELLDGEPMSDFLARGPHPPEEIVRIFLAIMDGVAAVHGAGVVHRDLKPDNVFLVPGDGGLIPKVLDFGVSKLYEPDRQQITALGMTMGTPYYMAPEQVTDSRSVDVRADVYSLGVMLYEALCGEVPYLGDTLLEIFTRALEGRPVPLRERVRVPPSLEALVARAMCAERDPRYSDVRAMRAALAAVPFDGSDHAEDWSDRSEPWMLDPSAGQHEVQPLESAPTQVGAMAKGSTVIMEQPVVRAARSIPRGTTVEMSPARTSVKPWVIAGAAALVVLGGAGAALLWALFG